jgi:hypothetical protein
VLKRDLLKRIADQAKVVGVDWELDRHGARHDVYKLGDSVIPVPRHSEIKQLTAQDIFKETETELGKGWWK